jgi:hypothetical protein
LPALAKVTFQDTVLPPEIAPTLVDTVPGRLIVPLEEELLDELEEELELLLDDDELEELDELELLLDDELDDEETEELELLERVPYVKLLQDVTLPNVPPGIMVSTPLLFLTIIAYIFAPLV